MVYNQVMAEQKTQKTFSLKEPFKFGWETTKKHFWFLFIFLLITQAISFGLSYFHGRLFENQNNEYMALGVLVYIASFVINLELGYAQDTVFLKLVDKKKAILKDIISYFDAVLLFRYFVLSLILTLIMFGGFLLFVIPGIYFVLKYKFTMNIFIAKQGKVGFKEALHESAKLTEGIKWQLFRYGIIQFLIGIAGILALLVGLFVAIPVIGLADFYLYRKLSATK